ncbi:MAG TPA: 2-oxo-4-hydroxy-4-carboxy-5-ureidoimidazoline decarboxylase [Jiangellales bacterium]|nr:2-oxo-4-hydroxy-4-carboxy-5-ureidoimidazoline decarboxylase [Jiangellales bacterium]
MAQFDGLGLAAFNSLPPEEAESVLMACCSSRRWTRLVADGRPYPTVDEVYEAADSAVNELTERDIDEALDGHPRIGERPSASHSVWSKQEQTGVSNAAADVHAALADRNRAYEERFGHVYLVCATGKSAEELLATLNDRLSNDPATERRVVRTELAMINRIRLERMLAGGEL